MRAPGTSHQLHTTPLVWATVIAHLDYCNSLLPVLLPLQTILKAGSECSFENYWKIEKISHVVDLISTETENRREKVRKLELSKTQTFDK